MSELTADTMHSAARGLELAVSMIRNGDMPQASAIANVARLCDKAGQTITYLRAEQSSFYAKGWNDAMAAAAELNTAELVAVQPDDATVERVDEARALEIFNDALGDMGSFAEYGSPSYQDGALRTIAVHLSRHRAEHRGENVRTFGASFRRDLDFWIIYEGQGDKEICRCKWEEVDDLLSLIRAGAAALAAKGTGNE